MTKSAPKIPFAGFRVVFALINAALWFGIAYGISWGVASKMESIGRFGPSFLPAAAASAAGLVGLYGGPGALSGFLDMAHSGRVDLPPQSKWGSGGQLDTIWMRGLVLGIAGAATAWALVSAAHLDLAPGRACLAVGLVAASLAALLSIYLSRPASLGDLTRAEGTTPRAADRSFVWSRIAVPQALGNGVMTAIVAIGSFTPADTIVPALAADSAGTALVVGVFMLVSSAGLAATDRRLGRVGSIDASPPSRLARVGLLVAATAIFGGLGALGGLVFAGNGPLAAYVAWKGLVGTVVGGVLSAVATRAALASRA